MAARARRNGLRGALSGAAAVALLAGVCIGAGGDSRGVERADVVTIDTIAEFGPLERPPVTFLHDLHTEALKEQGKDCASCHLEGEGVLFLPRFQRREDAGKQALMELYHSKCVECHVERAEGGLETGPVSVSDCGVCHRRSPGVVSVRRGMGFDKSLHYRHIEAEGEKCERCHHEYDEGKDELFHAKGEESSCRDCHGEKAVENREAMSVVSHQQCLGCHLEKEAEEAESGPLSCQGCHDPLSQLAHKRLERVPRLKRGQPDVALARPDDLKSGGMKTVPFRHRLHEEAEDSCRVCHHESLRACRECHTVPGGEEGDGIMLARAMHDTASSHSCVGCHDRRKRAADCAGCHAPMKPEVLDKKNCATCHGGPPPDRPGLAKMKDYSAFVPQRVYSNLSWKRDDVPEEIELKLLADEYDPAIFPHRKVIDALRGKIRESELAKTFHRGEDALCTSCHHASPVGMKPAACGNCHGKPSEGMHLGMPGLKGAYHLQCMGCHDKMRLEKRNDCTSCHKEKGR
ncbi:sulfate respiration complex hexadecaheme cytochrome HmcA [Elusimicrobiota bacterium]